MLIHNRIRELGSWLGEHLCESLESETEDDSRTESLEYLRQQLSTVEKDVRGIVEHIEECHRSLDRVDKVQGTCTCRIGLKFRGT